MENPNILHCHQIAVIASQCHPMPQKKTVWGPNLMAWQRFRNIHQIRRFHDSWLRPVYIHKYNIYIYIYIYVFWHGKFWQSSKYYEMSNAKKIYLTNTEKLFRVNFGWTFFGLVETTSGRQALWQLQCEQKRNAQGGPGLRDVQTYIYINIYIFFWWGKYA